MLMKHLPNLLLSLALILAEVTILPSVSLGQQRPLTLEDIRAALVGSKVGLPTTNLVLIKQISDRGVSFEINAENEKLLRDAGAEDLLVFAVRESVSATFSKLAEVCKKEDVECRLQNYNKALTALPDDTTALLNRGLAKHDGGDY